MAKILVLGAGVVGLGTAMLLADAGHDVTVLERDAADPVATPDEAWTEWDRRGVNQFRLPHFFLSRFRTIIDAELPSVARSIGAEGCLRQNPFLEIPDSIRGPERPEDAEFEVLTGRRSVMELAIARAATSTPRLEVRRGVTVEALLTGTEHTAGVPHVVGVATSDGELRADLVVDLMGRRSALPRLLEEAGGRPPAEEVDDFGFMYFGRHFRSPTGALPFSFGPALQHVGTISTLTLPCDNGTWGVVLVTDSKDKALLGLRDPDRWRETVQSFPLIAHWLDGEPLDDRVVTMSKIEDRIREYVVDGEPLATGIVSVGDAWACSNPMHGRGASIGMVHGLLLRDTVADVGLDDPTALVTAFYARTDEEVAPWFHWTRDEDRHRSREIAAGLDGREYRPGDERYELEQALSACATTDPELLRILLRATLVQRLLDDALADEATAARIRALGANWREAGPPGPSRDELVKLANG